MNCDLMEQMVRKLIGHEGIRLKPYLCHAGRLTIGIGRNIQDRGITESEAIFLCQRDIIECTEDLEAIFKEWSRFSDNRKMALIDMRFNLGPGGFRKFKKMIAAISREDWENAVKEAKDSDWFSQVGKRGETVTKMMMEG